MTGHEDEVRAGLQRLAEYARTEPRVPAEALVWEEPRRPLVTWTAGVAAAVLLVVAVTGVALSRRGGPSVVADGGLATLPGGATDLLAESGLAGRRAAASVWTGREVLVWGGMASTGSGSRLLADGAALDPVANRWRPLPPAPIAPRSDAAVVWTGREMVVWGGTSADEAADGAAFDPAANRWRTIAPNPLGAISRPAVVWTGAEMLVVGGQNGLRASAYDPTADRWRRAADPPGAPVGPYPQAVRTGADAAFVLWPSGTGLVPVPDRPGPTLPGPSGLVDPSSAGPPGTLPPAPASRGPNANMFVATYSPASDQWSRLPDVAFRDGTIPRLVWTGKELLALQLGAPGAAFAPATRAWRPIAPIPADVVPFGPAVWTGRHALLWSGGERGLAYDVAADAWSTFDAGGLDLRSDAVVVWAHDVLIGWGGHYSDVAGAPGPASDGVRYRPPS